MDNQDLYAPCPCGSGKKYKFCCQQTRRAQANQSARPLFWTVATADDLSTCQDELDPQAVSEGRRLCNEGLRLMAAGQLEKAIPPFEKAAALTPTIYTAANNLAICLFATGQLDEALQVQRESSASSPFPNPFGLANLATFEYIKGNEDEARRIIDSALKTPLPSVDACVKVCETLARLRRHQEILDTADASAYRDHPDVCFFTGVAAANLGDRRRAQHDLLRVRPGHHKADMTRRYLELLRNSSKPHTVRGDWPYLLCYEVCPGALINFASLARADGWFDRRIYADICETFINETADDPDMAVMGLFHARHPEATALLWLIVKGTFGPDSVRMKALQELHLRAEISADQEVEIFLQGKRQHVRSAGTKLDPDFRFGGELPKKVAALYEKSVKAGYGKRPDWTAIGENYLRVMKEAPAYYPARYNYAITLLYRGRTAEAEPLLRALIDEHPEYLFAHAALLQILINSDRRKEAEDLLTSAPVPAETHPEAMAAWLTAQAIYHEADGCFEEALRCIRTAHDLAPHLPCVQQLWEDYRDDG